MSDNIRRYIIKNEVPKSNWNQNDPNGLGYIEGRPFYEGLAITEILAETAYELEETKVGTNLGTTEEDSHTAYQTIVMNDLLADCTLGETYCVTIDGVSTHVVCKEITSDGVTMKSLGNEYVMDHNAENTGEDFMITVATQDGTTATMIGILSVGTSRTIKIEAVEEVVKTIDPKFIPSSFASIEYVDNKFAEAGTGSGGSTGGASTWSELSGVPIMDVFTETKTSVDIYPETELTFADASSSFASGTYAVMDATIVYVPLENLVDGDTLGIHIDSNSYEAEIKALSGDLEGYYCGNGSLLGAIGTYLGLADTGENFCIIAILENGAISVEWFATTETGDTHKIRITTEDVTVETHQEPLPSDYLVRELPVSWDSLLDRPFYSEKITTTLFDKTLTVEDASDLFLVSNDSDLNALTLVEGETYTVILDGTEYENVATVGDLNGDGSATYKILGDLSGETYPYAIIVFDQEVAAMDNTKSLIGVYDTNTSHTFKIIGKSEVVKKIIDKKFLPDNVASEAIESALSEAKTYTDEKVADEVSDRQSAISTAISTEVTDRKNGDADTLEAAKAYTDEKSTASQTYTDEKVADEATIREEALSTEITNRQNGDADTLEAAKAYTDEKMSSYRNAFGLIDTITGYNLIVQIAGGSIYTKVGCKSIYIETMPDKTSYIDGDLFDPTGMVVKLIRFDGTIETLSEEYYTYNELITDGNVEIKYIDELGNEFTASVVLSYDENMTIEDELVDFEYTANNDGTYTITDWKGTYNGEVSTKCIVPGNVNIKL